MKKIALITLTMLLAAGPVLAGPASNPDATLAVGTAQISRGDLARLRDMVAGRTTASSSPAAPLVETVDTGRVQLSRQDLDRLRAMVAGDYRAPADKARIARNEAVDVGKVVAGHHGFEQLKRMVARHLQDDLHLSALTD